MIAENSPIVFNLLRDAYFLFKILFVAFAIIYFLFTLVVVRQVFLMTETVQTEGGALIRALSIFYGGLSLGVVILFIGLL